MAAKTEAISFSLAAEQTPRLRLSRNRKEDRKKKRSNELVNILSFRLKILFFLSPRIPTVPSCDCAALRHLCLSSAAELHHFRALFLILWRGCNFFFFFCAFIFPTAQTGAGTGMRMRASATRGSLYRHHRFQRPRKPLRRL